MRSAKSVLTSIALLWGIAWAGAHVAEAGRLGLTWDYTAVRDGATFTITVTPSQGEEREVAAGDATACAWAKDATPETRCTILACPTAGVYTYWVTAKQGQTETSPSNIVTCNIVSTGGGCDCEVLDDTPGPDAPPGGEALLRSGVPVESPVDAPAPVPDTPGEAPPVLAVAVPVMGAVGSLGGGLVVSWTYPREGAAVPERFVIGMQGGGGSTPVLLAVPLHGASACTGVPGAGAGTWCARVGCPGAGVWSFAVQADHGGLGAPSGSVTCTIQPGAGCVCTPGVSIVAHPV